MKEDRKEFEIFINRKNKDWVDQGVFLELIVWEDFLDAVSKTRLQDEYNKAIREYDIFVMLFCTKVGKYTEEGVRDRLRAVQGHQQASGEDPHGAPRGVLSFGYESWVNFGLLDELP